jgi:hypothetical protein
MFKNGVNMTFSKLVSYGLIVLVILEVGCSGKKEIPVPETIVDKKMTKLIYGEEAINVIDELHGLDVATEENIIAQYGENPKDLLYISRYDTKDQARESLQLMITKMIETDEGPFTHIRTLPDYEDNVYISIGMGAIHYIYRSTKYILWLQTYQEIGRELPNELIKLYPVH